MKELERRYKELNDRLHTGALDPNSQAALQEKARLDGLLKKNEDELEDRLQKAMQERELWEQAATADLVHLSEPLVKLELRRQTLRTAHRFWRHVDPDTMRYVVAIGPAGVGKSTFIKQLLDDHGYRGGPQQQGANPVPNSTQLQLGAATITAVYW